ncbi:hypothetical protein QQ045_015096 [Rhodiola kirilowii]
MANSWLGMLLLAGTERLNYFYAATIMEHPLMSGQSGAFSPRFLAENPYSPELSASTGLN